MFRTVSFAALLTALSCSAFAAGTPVWLKTPLQKPLGRLTIGITQNNAGTDSYESTYEQTMRDYAKALRVHIILLDPQGDPVKQSSQVQDLIAQHVDVMIVWPTNAKAVVPALRQAHKAGIPVVITNSRVDPSGVRYTVSYSGPDTVGEGRIAGKLMQQALGGKGDVVIINGTPGYSRSIDCDKGFMEAISSTPGIKILATEPADWNRENAQSVMENLITRFGAKIDGVYAEDDNMGIGALNAVTAAVQEGKYQKDAVKIVGAANFADGYDAIKAGDFYGSVVQSPVKDAENALKVAVEVAEGQPVPKEDFIDTPPVTAANINQFTRPVF
jgi:ribose transport system substrate-binding protein